MDDLQKELNELKQFIVELKADRAATKEKEKREGWTKWVSMSVVIIAVVAAIAAQRAGKYSSTVQLSQAQASDEWNFYQASSIKQKLYEMRKARLPKEGGTPEEMAERKDIDAKLKDYENRKNESQAKAQGLEKKRDDSSHLGSRMGPTGSCFTVAIAIASICLTTKKKPLWYIAIAMAGLGILYWAGVIEHLFNKAV